MAIRARPDEEADEIGAIVDGGFPVSAETFRHQFEVFKSQDDGWLLVENKDGVRGWTQRRVGGIEYALAVDDAQVCYFLKI